jgi:putative addiction module component (TIGR02574 family)
MMQLASEEIGQLSPKERLNLVEQLWDSLTDDEVPISSPQEVELDRRMKTLEHDRKDAVAWEELKAGLKRHSR